MCKGLTVRERKYWIEYLNYKQKLEQFRKSMAPTQK